MDTSFGQESWKQFITKSKESTLKEGGFNNSKPNGLKKLRTIGLLE
jgi:hypothetical protein